MKSFWEMMKRAAPALCMVLALVVTFAVAGEAMADLATETQTAVTSAKDTALTIGGYVVAAIVALTVVGLAIKMVNKL